ncbi:MAG: polyphosphate polymerase domain-containing protein [Defluviitaleaceae bacterium]|nr:polyphosphate polymerase domain-containing protein [Defluviitaleaceae bacterium]
MKRVKNMQSVFKRGEKKYLISSEQARSIETMLFGHMIPDRGDYWVQNLYFDNDNWDIVNTSMSKPYYKEKMRLRCYGSRESTNNVFLELKKKYAGIVYKRRIAMPMQSLDFPLEDVLAKDKSQIARELEFHIKSTQVKQKMFISYQRKALAGIGEDSALRLTFDKNVRYRLNELNFSNPEKGQLVFPEDSVIMEIKTSLSIPMWLARFLSENKIFGTSCSKYGTCFTDYWQNLSNTQERLITHV